MLFHAVLTRTKADRIALYTQSLQFGSFQAVYLYHSNGDTRIPDAASGTADIIFSNSALLSVWAPKI